MSNRLEPPSAEPNRVPRQILSILTNLTIGTAYVIGVLVGGCVGYYTENLRSWDYSIFESFSYWNQSHYWTILLCGGALMLICGAFVVKLSGTAQGSKAKEVDRSTATVIVVICAICSLIFGCFAGWSIMLDLSRY